MNVIPDDKPYQYAKQSSDVINISKAMANWVDSYTCTFYWALCAEDLESVLH